MASFESTNSIFRVLTAKRAYIIPTVLFICAFNSISHFFIAFEWMAAVAFFISSSSVFVDAGLFYTLINISALMMRALC